MAAPPDLLPPVAPIVEGSHLKPSPTETDTLLSLTQEPDVSERVVRGRHRRQLYAWWSYAVAAECFAAVAQTVFLPLALEQTARERGFLEPDHTISCMTPGGDDGGAGSDPHRCKALIAGIWIDTASFSLYTYSISVLLQALLVICLGKIADHPPHRKIVLLFFAALGSSSAIAFLIFQAPSILCILGVIAVASLGVSFVCFNAFLPDLGRQGPQVRAAHGAWKAAEERHGEAPAGTGGEDERPGLMLPGPEFSEETDQAEGEGNRLLPDLSIMVTTQAAELRDLRKTYISAISRYTSKISLIAIATGYVGGCLLLVPAFVLVTQLEGSTFSLRLAVALSGSLWLICSFPAARWLGSIRGWRGGDDWRGWRAEVAESWMGLGRMLRPAEIRRIPNTFGFLLCWMFLSDAAATFSSTAIIFAKTSLKMSSSEVTIVALLAQVTGVIGGFSAPYVQTRLGLSNKRALLSLVLIMTLLPLYGCIGLIGGPEGWGGLRTPTEMYIVASCFGLCFGPFQSFARTVFAELIPPGQEARFFGLYSITDKSSSFIGPAVVGVVADLTGEIRFAFIFLLAMLAIPVPLLSRGVDVDKGREDAAVYSSKEDGSGRRAAT